MQQGIEDIHAKEYLSAVLNFDRALSLPNGEDEQRLRAYSSRGIALEKMGRDEECLGNYEDAIASCDRALTIKPDDPQTLTHLGDVLRQVGRFQEAMTACDRALELKPHYTDAFYTKAVIFALQGDTNQVLVNSSSHYLGRDLHSQPKLCRHSGRRICL